ncbi:cytochrome P450 [Russula brevipes]|nr:cytochrome P450 [Russula brevipes]
MASLISLTAVIDLALLLTFLFAIQSFRDHRKRKGLPYPPGPRPLPVIGNLLDIPREFSWLTYTELAKKHGDVMSFHIPGQVIVILGSTKATKDLLERRGHTFSDRPVIPIFEMMEVQWSLLVARFGDSWRLGRKIAERGFRPATLATYHGMQQTKARVLATRLLENPQEWIPHLELFQGEQLLAMTYGYEVKGHSDKMLDSARSLSDLGTSVVLPGASLVNELPFLRHIPEWLPWFSYKPLARIGRDLGEKVKNDTMQFVRESILDGTAQQSLAHDGLIEAETLSGPEREAHEKAIAETLGTMLRHTDGFPSVSQTVASLMTLVLAVLLQPEVQRRAQEEIDSVTRRERFPTFEDRPKLPFVGALCKEVLRWRPAAPLHIPHASTEDFVYEGLFIPKGTIYLISIICRAITHDPDIYPEPDAFKPERFLNPDGTLRDDPTLSSVFGFGKRVCPGRYFVDDTLFIVASTVLSVLNIGKGRGCEDGQFEYSYISSLVSRPNPFPCSITARDKRAEELIISTDSTAA